MKKSAEAFEGSTCAELRDIAHAGLPPGTARKGLYSELVEHGYGFEAVALLTEHGTNALLPGGPYSLAPYKIYRNLGREAIDVVHAGAVSTVLDRLAEHSLAAQEGAPTLLNLGDAAKALHNDEMTCLELPGFSALPLPTPGQWNDFHDASDGFKRFVTRAQSASTDQLKTALAFALCRCGLPLKNLRRRALNYRFGSFILPRDLPGFFVGLTRQHDRGLGLVSLPLEQSELAVRRILQLLGERGGIDPRQRLFGDFKFSREALAKFVRRCLVEKEGARRLDDSYLLAMVDRCSTFTSLMQLGGFLTFAMRDELIVPANFYDVSDMLRAKGVPEIELRGTDGLPWRNPYRATTEALSRALSDYEFYRLVGVEATPRRRGRPHKLPFWFPYTGKDLSAANNATLARLVAFYKPCPSFSFVRELIIRIGCRPEKDASRRAGRVLGLLYRKGWGCTGKPLRYLAPDRIVDLVTRAVEYELPARVKNPVTRDKLAGIILTMSAIGTRLGEAMRVRKGDICGIGAYESMRIHGTKVARARREICLDLFRTGPGGAALFDLWRKSIASRCESLQEGKLLFASEDEGCKRTSELLKDVLDPAFRWVGGIRCQDEGEEPRTEGVFTGYTLRHLVAIRLVQGAIDSHFRHGNFACALSEIAASMGHSFPTLLSSYLGTAASAVKW
jgi:hypothetical protein